MAQQRLLLPKLHCPKKQLQLQRRSNMEATWPNHPMHQLPERHLQQQAISQQMLQAQQQRAANQQLGVLPKLNHLQKYHQKLKCQTQV